MATFHFAKTMEYCRSHCHPTPDHCCNSTTKCLIFCPSTCLYPLFTKPSPPHPPTNSHHQHLNLASKLLIPLIIVTLALLFFLLFALYLKLDRRRRRTVGRGSAEAELDVAEDRGGPVTELDHPIWYIRTLGLQPSVISAITVFKYRKNDGVVDVSDCAICLTEFHEGDTLRLLHKCNHAFHTPCIDTWLRSHTNCPMCRAPIVAPLPASEEEEGCSSGSVRGEVRVRISEELGRGIEGRELGFRSDEESQLGFRNESSTFKEDDDACIEKAELEATRRSVSMDCRATNNAKTGDFNMELFNVMSSNGGGSRGIYLQSSGATMSPKRSLSCGAKLFLSRYAPA